MKLNELMSKLDDVFIIPVALRFLYEKGYLTKEEYVNRKSKRLIDIRVWAPKFTNTAFVVLFFDNNEWNIEVEIDTMLNVISVSLKTEQYYQVLYDIENIGE